MESNLEAISEAVQDGAETRALEPLSSKVVGGAVF